MFYNIIFFFKEFKNFLIGILNQIELLIKENKEAEFKIFTNQNKKFFFRNSTILSIMGKEKFWLLVLPLVILDLL